MKRLIVCFDGTWNNADNPGAETNVSRLSRSIRSDDERGVVQSVLYLRGVGTTGLDTTKFIAGAIGLGVDDNIRSAYMFLAQNFEAGDQIFLFGFSRGSFTARSLVGLIACAGLLRRASLAYLGKAWEYYRTHKPHSPELFRQANPDVVQHQGVKIDFVGVWDTVGAMGIPGGIFADVNRDLYGFYDTSPCPIMKRACHAMAIDEHRDSFVPTLWTGATPPDVRIDQVWFAGVHSDVGGGYVSRRLADIPLWWMVRQAQAEGLYFDERCLPDPATLQPLEMQHDSSHGLFALNHLVPTFRTICGKTFAVPPYQRLYAPVDASGHPVVPINESIHQSVIDRYTHQAGFCTNDDAGQATQAAYTPKNLAPVFAAPGAVAAGIHVTPY
jgi:uncharacterized protein (DUF2235 family)